MAMTLEEQERNRREAELQHLYGRVIVFQSVLRGKDPIGPEPRVAIAATFDDLLATTSKSSGRMTVTALDAKGAPVYPPTNECQPEREAAGRPSRSSARD
jgi:hypothetical protein